MNMLTMKDYRAIVCTVEKDDMSPKEIERRAKDLSFYQTLNPDESTLSRVINCESGDCLLYTDLGNGYEYSAAVVRYRLANGI
jgi:hypothetical protein